MFRKPHVFRKHGIWFCSSRKDLPAVTQGETASLAYTRWKWGGAIIPSWQIITNPIKDKS